MSHDMTGRDVTSPDSSCESVRSTLSAAPGDMTPALRAHLERCKACRQVHQVTVFLGSLASETTAPLPTPAAELWHRAQVIQRLVEQQGREQRALRPVLWTQWAVLGLVVVSLSFLGLNTLYDLAPQRQTLDSAWFLWLLIVGTVPLVLGLPITAWLMLDDA